MKLHRHPNTVRKLVAATHGLVLLAGVTQAAPFLYSPGDLILAFRQTGNATDLVVNAGPASALSALPANTTIPVANLSATQLLQTFPSINELTWSVSAANRPPTISRFPLQTLWVSAPRAETALPSPPWLRKGQFVQGNAASQIDAIGNNAAAYSGRQPAGPDNTATGVAIPVGNDAAYTLLIGAAGDYAGTFQGNSENTTPDDFDGDPQNVSRSDLYELTPGTTANGTLNLPGRYLGYFELTPLGTITFNTLTTPTPSPTITHIERNGDSTTVSFTTVAGASYQLRSTDANGLPTPILTWTAGASIVGTGSILSLVDTGSDSIRFFSVEVIP